METVVIRSTLMALLSSAWLIVGLLILRPDIFWWTLWTIAFPVILLNAMCVAAHADFVTQEERQKHE